MKEYEITILGKKYIAHADNQSELEEVLSENYQDFEYTIEEVLEVLDKKD